LEVEGAPCRAFMNIDVGADRYADGILAFPAISSNHEIEIHISNPNYLLNRLAVVD
jgi:hypothetical protein